MPTLSSPRTLRWGREVEVHWATSSALASSSLTTSAGLISHRALRSQGFDLRRTWDHSARALCERTNGYSPRLATLPARRLAARLAWDMQREARRDVLLLTGGEDGDPAAADGRGCASEDLEAAQAETEVLDEGVHLGWLAEGVGGVAFPDDDVGVWREGEEGRSAFDMKQRKRGRMDAPLLQ